MRYSYQEIVEKLESQGVYLSPQRKAIIEYLASVKDGVHLNVEDIYNDLRREFPRISKASIYTTVAFLVENGFISELYIGNGSRYFDMNFERHAHFYCTKCGNIYDITDEEINEVLNKKNIDNHRIENAFLVYRGICSNCLKKMSNG